MTLKQEPLLAPALAQAIISITAILGIKGLGAEDREAVTTLILAAWAIGATLLELIKRSKVTPVKTASENVVKVLESSGANPENVERAKETIKQGEPVYLPTAATDLPRARYE